MYAYDFKYYTPAKNKIKPQQLFHQAAHLVAAEMKIKHPSVIKKQLPSMLRNRLSQLSCNQEKFAKAIPEYEVAMRKSEYSGGLQYINIPGSRMRKRKRNIVWFSAKKPKPVYCCTYFNLDVSLNAVGIVNQNSATDYFKIQ